MSGKSKTSNGDLRVVTHRPHIELFRRVVLIVVCLALWAVGFLVGGWQERRVPVELLYEEREHLLSKIVEYRNHISDLEVQVAQKGVELDIAKESSEKVRADYRVTFEKLDQLQAQLAHYQRVLKPEAGDQGVVMGLLKISNQDSPSQYRFSVDFFQTLDRQKLSGKVELILTGRLNGEQKTWRFTELAEKPLRLNLGFRHYQTLEGSISLPDGVSPLEVVVNARITGGKAVTLSKVFPWTLKPLSDELSSQF